MGKGKTCIVTGQYHYLSTPTTRLRNLIRYCYINMVGLHRPSTPPGMPPPSARRRSSKLCFGTVCSSNINRSMEAHVRLQNAGMSRYCLFEYCFCAFCSVITIVRYVYNDLAHRYFPLHLHVIHHVTSMQQTLITLHKK